MSGPIVSTYYVSWAMYDRKHEVADLPAKDLTHILYAFANVNDQGVVVLGDAWADTDKHYSDDSWNDSGKNLYGNFKRLALLKRKNRQLKVSLSIGGWTWSTHFSAVAKDPSKRQTFVNSSMTLLNDLGLDGLDIDWEYPKTPEDAVNYVSLLRELRQALDSYASSKNDPVPYLLTGAMPCGESHYSLLRVGEMAQYLDYFYLMAYDFAGSWCSTAGHQANLLGGETNVHKAVEFYRSNGVPSTKLVMGLPIYGRAFQNTGGIGQPYDGIGPGHWEQGVYDYKKLPLQGAVEYFDPETISAYSYDVQKRELVTYDTPVVLQRKAEYIRNNQLAGAMFWESSADHPENHERSLIFNIARSLGSAQGLLDKTPNHLDFPTSSYDNVRNGFQ